MRKKLGRFSSTLSPVLVSFLVSSATSRVVREVWVGACGMRSSAANLLLHPNRSSPSDCIYANCQARI